MKEHLFSDNTEPVRKLEDLIEVRVERGHVGTFDEEIEVSEDVDVDDALTFPHPRHGHRELAAETSDEDTDSEEEQDVQPTDYSHYYDEATDAHRTDEEEEIIEEEIHVVGHVSVDEMVDGCVTRVMSNTFTPDEDPEESPCD